jgi:hypothetical protein
MVIYFLLRWIRYNTFLSSSMFPLFKIYTCFIGCAKIHSLKSMVLIHNCNRILDSRLWVCLRRACYHGMVLIF